VSTAPQLTGAQYLGLDAPQKPSGDEASPVAAPLISTLPIGVAADGRTLLLFLANEANTEGFRSFLQTHASRARLWTHRIS
jgi:hypothetical protein